jgi:hypothetical protein
MSSHPLANHLNQLHDRITGMLMPGLKTAPGGQTYPSFLKDFGGLKYKIAARKMRSLDPAKLGSLQPARIVRRLIAPLAESRNLLHLKSLDDNSPTWNEVETIFPSSIGEAESSPQGGEFRQGSIIPRLATFPKPGQSIESFKKQVEQYPKAPAPPVEPPQRPLSPKSRLFSHVQEIETKKTDESQESEALTPEKMPPLPEPLQGKTLQLPQKEAEVKPPLKEEEAPGSPPLPLVSHVDETDSVEKQVTPPPIQPTAKESPPLARPVETKTTGSMKTPSTTTPSPEEKPKGISPDEEISLPLALPAKPPEKSTFKEKKPAASKPGSPSQSPRAVKSSRQPPSTQLPKPEIPLSHSLTPDLSPSTPDSVSEPEPAQSKKTPIRRQIDYRKKPPIKTRSLIPENIKEPAFPPAQTRMDKPLISPQKYSSSTPGKVQRQAEDHQPASFFPSAQPQAVSENLRPVTAPGEISENLQPVTRPGEIEEILEYRQPVRQAQTRNIQPTLRPSSISMSQPISMALAYPPHRVDQKNLLEKAKSPAPATVSPAEKLSPNTQLPALITRSASVKNVIQRKWPENEGVTGPTTAGGGSQASERSSSASSAPPIDLAYLAEEVFPYLKRLIEIESDRLSSRFG